MHNYSVLKRTTGHIISTHLRSGDTPHLLVTSGPYHSGDYRGEREQKLSNSTGPQQILSNPFQWLSKPAFKFFHNTKPFH